MANSHQEAQFQMLDEEPDQRSQQCSVTRNGISQQHAIGIRGYWIISEELAAEWHGSHVLVTEMDRAPGTCPLSENLTQQVGKLR